ncbi:MAG: PQ-loop domain-containing transporter [Actinomycetota bacterium]|nr:PQ-loop domain-containing transporter [Actinomycetota bacterium]
MAGSVASDVTAVLAVVAPGLTIARTVPQGVRVARHGAEGVSVSTWVLLLAVAELWTIYGFFAKVPAEVATNVPNGLLCLAVVVLVARRRKEVARTLVLTALVSAAVALLSVLCALGHVEGIEAAVSVAGSLSLYLPQLVIALRARDLSGVSLSSWLLALCGSIAWGAYGLFIHKVAVYVPTIVMLPSAAAISIAIVSSSRARTLAREAATR